MKTILTMSHTDREVVYDEQIALVSYEEREITIVDKENMIIHIMDMFDVNKIVILLP